MSDSESPYEKVKGRVNKWRKRAVFEIAKKRLGQTSDPRESGYVLPQGEMIDFSGKNQGGTPHTRALDHSEVDKEAFARRGAIRMHYDVESLYVTLEHDKKPTQEQWGQMHRMERITRDYPKWSDHPHRNKPALFYEIFEGQSLKLRGEMPFDKHFEKRLRWTQKASKTPWERMVRE